MRVYYCDLTTILLFVMLALRKSLQIIRNSGTPGGFLLHIAHLAGNLWTASATVRSKSYFVQQSSCMGEVNPYALC